MHIHNRSCFIAQKRIFRQKMYFDHPMKVRISPFRRISSVRKSDLTLISLLQNLSVSRFQTISPDGMAAAVQSAEMVPPCAALLHRVGSAVSQQGPLTSSMHVNAPWHRRNSLNHYVLTRTSVTSTIALFPPHNLKTIE